MPLPKPQPGLVIRYSYLWHNESLAGQEEGVKDRPCAVVMSAPRGDKHKVMVIPITTQKPQDSSACVELPDKTKKRLGLSSVPMWVICSEVNEFFWPGPDIRPVSSKPKKYDYGILPPKLYAQIKTKIQFCANGNTLKVISRTV